MKTTIIFTDGGGNEDHVCLDGAVVPTVVGPLVQFAALNGEKFYVNLSRFVGSYILQPEDNVVPIKPEVVAAN